MSKINLLKENQNKLIKLNIDRKNIEEEKNIIEKEIEDKKTEIFDANKKLQNLEDKKLEILTKQEDLKINKYVIIICSIIVTIAYIIGCIISSSLLTLYPFVLYLATLILPVMSNHNIKKYLKTNKLEDITIAIDEIVNSVENNEKTIKLNNNISKSLEKKHNEINNAIGEILDIFIQDNITDNENAKNKIVKLLIENPDIYESLFPTQNIEIKEENFTNKENQKSKKY